MMLRLMVMKPLLAALVLVLVAACGSDNTPQATSGGGGTSLSQDQVAKAQAVAREVAEDQGASVSSASVIARSGTVKDSNTGHPCTSGRELEILLIGEFPHTVTTGHAVAPGSPTPDFTVRAMNITADAETGRACLIGVQPERTAPSSPRQARPPSRSVKRSRAGRRQTEGMAGRDRQRELGHETVEGDPITWLRRRSGGTA